jgi:hypothetical protein
LRNIGVVSLSRNLGMPRRMRQRRLAAFVDATEGSDRDIERW